MVMGIRYSDNKDNYCSSQCVIDSLWTDISCSLWGYVRLGQATRNTRSLNFNNYEVLWN